GQERSLKLMADTLALTAPELRAFVVHGIVGYDTGGNSGGKGGTGGGFDELTPFGPTTGFAVDQGRVTPFRLDPREVGLACDDPDQVRVADKPAALAALKAVLTGRANTAMQAMTALNLGAALHLATGRELSACMAEAREAVADGAARRFAGEGSDE
ncbi:MAG: hypothetical protein C0405_14940, partial [Desulfovibrio sp.]|nr:hypothetical protein [Desulfovibrio sp.]